MKYFLIQEIGRIFVLSLEPGDYVLESIIALIKREDLMDAVVISGIGSLDHCRIHWVTSTSFPPKDHFEKWEDRPMELASVNGVIANGEPHLHVVVSEREIAHSGHLEKGCRVLYLAEIVILEIKSANLIRTYDDQHILRLDTSNNHFSIQLKENSRT